MKGNEASVSQMRLWPRLLWLCLLIAALLALFWSTYASIVSIWWRSETFAHGFLVLPIVAFLVWRKRLALQQATFRTDPRALPLLGVTGLIWFLAHLADVAVIEQLAGVLLIPLLIWMTLGWTTVRILAFPLGFLLFAVPMGEGLIEPLMQFTATFTVSMLRLTGIPVFWEGTFFSLPSGDWSVVEACSGLRYLIASLFLGVLYAYLNYRSLWRRVAFIVLSAIVPILANGLRAYMIVMLGHLSGMKLAVGIDHLIYGWVFFGIVMFLLFAIGNLWSEAPLPEAADPRTPPSASVPESAARGHAILILGLLLLALWPMLGASLDRSRTQMDTVHFEMPQGQAGWRTLTSAQTDWTPRYLDAALEMRQDFQHESDSVGLYLAFYGNADGELINSQNVMAVQKDEVWRMPYRRSTQARIAGEDVTLSESQIQSSGQKLLVWNWYWIDGHHVANDYVAKLFETLAVILGRDHRQAGIVLYTPMGAKAEPARERLRRFTEEMLPAIDDRLDAMP
ncbi:exosortase 1 [Thiocystis violascens DSM 198]|uniref:Exosortase 1 n=2 Tax=Thiocystis violascens TaxID=73141 RepID=I3YGE6_THIV6|nr:exosortase 1 [Thiocystis violascens DSM 198]